ncbi:MAG: iron-sulfur cluster assembly scaffold protein [Xanthomonadales bacterium]|nr:iron-sulfur cluster assembly scaffold protein [Xanthomonadales bacterium]
MSAAAALYGERLLEHARQPRWHGLLPPPATLGQASNRLCGDDVQVSLRLDGDHIMGFGFEADACAMTVAAASMLGDAIASRTLEEVAALATAFGDWLTSAGDDQTPAEIVQKTGFDAFAELKKLPSRRRCALLPFEAWEMAFRSRGH